MSYEKALVEETGFCKLIRVVCNKVTAVYESGITEITRDLVCKLLNDAYCSAVKNSGVGLAFTENPPTNMKGYRHSQKYLEHIFLDEKTRGELKGHLSETEIAMNKLVSDVVNQGKAPFPAYSSIEEYLTQYYELLKAVLKITDELQDAGGVGTKFIQNILNIGLEFPEDYVEDTEKGAYASLYASGVLNGIARLYGALEEYGKCAAEITAEKVRENYQEVLISKILRYFNWVIVHNGEIMRVEMPACLYEEKDTEWPFSIPIRPLEACNSYEGIGEMRLLDKVLYDIDTQ